MSEPKFWLGKQHIIQPGKAGDPPRLFFKAFVEFSPVQPVPPGIGEPAIIIEGSAPFDGARSWDQTEQLIAQDALRMLTEAAQLTPQQLATGLARSRQYEPLFPDDEALPD